MQKLSPPLQKAAKKVPVKRTPKRSSNCGQALKDAHCETADAEIKHNDASSEMVSNPAENTAPSASNIDDILDLVAPDPENANNKTNSATKSKKKTEHRMKKPSRPSEEAPRPAQNKDLNDPLPAPKDRVAPGPSSPKPSTSKDASETNNSNQRCDEKGDEGDDLVHADLILSGYESSDLSEECPPTPLQLPECNSQRGKRKCIFFRVTVRLSCSLR